MIHKEIALHYDSDKNEFNIVVNGTIYDTVSPETLGTTDYIYHLIHKMTGN